MRLNAVKSGQTMMLITIVEILLGLLVLAVIGMGLLGMVSNINVLQHFFAKDNAYILDSLHAVPNGNLEYGYLWSGDDYNITFERGSVAVSREPARAFLSFKKPPAVTKVYGTSSLTTEPFLEAFSPKYYQFSVREKQDRVIQIIKRVALETCPAGGPISTISMPERGESGASEAITTAVINAVRQERSTTTTGPSVAVIFRGENDEAVSVYAQSQTDVTRRLSCVVTRHLNRESISAVEDSLANLPESLREIEADLIIVVRGNPQHQSRYREALQEGLLDYWREETALNAQTPAQVGGTS